MKFWKAVSENWKTNLAGLVTFLFSIPAFVTAIQSWAGHQPVDWRAVAVAVAMAAGGAGLFSAKDGTTHSTPAEVNKAGRDEAKAESKAA